MECVKLPNAISKKSFDLIIMALELVKLNSCIFENVDYVDECIVLKDYLMETAKKYQK